MSPEELKDIRKAAGLSQEELGDAIGMTATSIGLMERKVAEIKERTEKTVDEIVRMTIDVSYSRSLGKWTVAVVQPIWRESKDAPPGRRHEILGIYDTKEEAQKRAGVEQDRHPTARIISRGI